MIRTWATCFVLKHHDTITSAGTHRLDDWLCYPYITAPCYTHCAKNHQPPPSLHKTAVAQIHSSLGPLMHSVFRMFTDLARFGALMLVIVLGFSLAFYALFGSTSATLPDGGLIAAYDTYYTSVLTLFGSMLGNFDFSVRIATREIRTKGFVM